MLREGAALPRLSDCSSLGDTGEAAALVLVRARWEPQARADAGDRARWDAAWEAGAEMSIEDALALAAGSRDEIEAQQASVTPPARV